MVHICILVFSSSAVVNTLHGYVFLTRLARMYCATLFSRALKQKGYVSCIYNVWFYNRNPSATHIYIVMDSTPIHFDSINLILIWLNLLLCIRCFSALIAHNISAVVTSYTWLPYVSSPYEMCHFILMRIVIQRLRRMRLAHTVVYLYCSRHNFIYMANTSSLHV